MLVSCGLMVHASVEFHIRTSYLSLMYQNDQVPGGQLKILTNAECLQAQGRPWKTWKGGLMYDDKYYMSIASCVWWEPLSLSTCNHWCNSRLKFGSKTIQSEFTAEHDQVHEKWWAIVGRNNEIQWNHWRRSNDLIDKSWKRKKLSISVLCLVERLKVPCFFSDATPFQTKVGGCPVIYKNWDRWNKYLCAWFAGWLPMVRVFSIPCCVSQRVPALSEVSWSSSGFQSPDWTWWLAPAP